MSRTHIVKNIIGNATKFVSVTFRKKDGSARTIVHNPRVTKGIKGDAASESAKKAVASRKANNPNLVSVFDSQLAASGTPANACWRTINCDTVISIRCDGEEIKFS